ncbi:MULTISPECIES: anthranilate synthase component I family protein [unclassified Streptomyces]|uniref:anthranilate synthase component I family protein n=1 Tax=unclassified Streptomyces TaxID=2593676 RepID=UPI001BE7E51B|nr:MULTISPECIES: anthranilate synthase component I family protein [unclassified Streptomyces]MBT2405503.1 anthranilate synthase component I family protein [Streptomyces sp. ISL-21]MBT2607818.1 anthranilate synthase component I family protein [Streptomyces sp. ISL-87]
MWDSHGSHGSHGSYGSYGSSDSSLSAVAVEVGVEELAPHAPLELYEALRAVLPAEEVFLFESLEGAAADRRSAVVGFGRLAEIRVHADRVEVDGATPALKRALAGAVEAAGLVTDGPAAGCPVAHHPLPEGPYVFRLERSEQVWDALGRAQGLFSVTTELPETGYAFGFLTSLAYESAWHMEELPARDGGDGGRPDITLTLFRDTVWYDVNDGRVRRLHADSPAFTGSAELPELPELPEAPELPERRAAGYPPAPAPRSVRDSVDRDTFLGWAARCLEHIGVGDVYQIQIGHRLDVESELTPLEVYRRLRGRNPSPYMYLVPQAGRTLIGASPELFFRIEDGEIVMRPIAGTARRGPDDEVNQRRVKEMRESTKEQAEHIMLVDLCRNDIGRVSLPSTQPVDRLMEVETFSHVFHLVSTVSGRLDPAVGVWDAVRATFPAGTMSGAPKLRAMEIIDGLEQERRGAYAGAVGLVDVRGWSELALCIRTIEYDGLRYSTQSSAGMVAQSDPESEWQETLAKMGAAYWALTGEELLP